MTACASNGASTDAITCGITLTPAHLDAAIGSGGFGGLAFIPGGASITNR